MYNSKSSIVAESEARQSAEIVSRLTTLFRTITQKVSKTHSKRSGFGKHIISFSIRRAMHLSYIASISKFLARTKAFPSACYTITFVSGIIDYQSQLSNSNRQSQTT